jgi:hypothetical protein
MEQKDTMKQTDTMEQTLPKIFDNEKTPKKKNNYKNMMTELMKPLPKEEKSNIHLGGGVFPKLEKI